MLLLDVCPVAITFYPESSASIKPHYRLLLCLCLGLRSISNCKRPKNMFSPPTQNVILSTNELSATMIDVSQ
jgi:hypothetical protein